MSIKAGNWAIEWKRTLLIFEKSNESATKKFKVPSKTKWWQSDKKADFGKSLEELDAVYSKISKKFKTQKWSREACALFGNAVGKAEKAGKAYTATLRNLLDKESKAPWMQKAIGAEYENALKIVKKDIKACVTHAISEYMDQKLAAEKAAKGDAGLDKQKKVLFAKIAAQYKQLAVLAEKSKSEPAEYFADKDKALGSAIAVLEVALKMAKTPVEISQPTMALKGLNELKRRQVDKMVLSPVSAGIQQSIDRDPKVLERQKALKGEDGANAVKAEKELLNERREYWLKQAKIEMAILVPQIKVMSTMVKAAAK